MKYHSFVEALKTKRFNNIIAFTGPGIGVPDFKSRQNLEFLQKDFLKEFNILRPEQIFDVEFYRKKPEAFTKLAREFLIQKAQCGGANEIQEYSWTSELTPAHKFV